VFSGGEFVEGECLGVEVTTRYSGFGLIECSQRFAISSSVYSPGVLKGVMLL